MAAKLVLVRIDDRLLHGQVAIGWVKATMPTHLVVANDAVAGDPVQRSLMELAAPSTLKVTICRVQDTASLCNGIQLHGQRVLLLFANPRDALQAVTDGLEVKEINVGGLRYQPGKRQIMKAVSIDAQDSDFFRKLIERGIAVKVQMVPTDDPVDIRKYLAP